MLNLKKLRMEKGLSQQALAEEFNLSQQSIYKYEHFLAEPDIKTLKKMAAYFNVSVDYLIGYSDSRAVPPAETLNPSEEELRLLHRLRQLTPSVRSSVTTLIDHLQP